MSALLVCEPSDVQGARSADLRERHAGFLPYADDALDDASRVSLSEAWDGPESGGAGMVLFGMVRQFGQIAPSLLHSLRIMPQLYML